MYIEKLSCVIHRLKSDIIRAAEILNKPIYYYSLSEHQSTAVGRMLNRLGFMFKVARMTRQEETEVRPCGSMS